MLSIVSFVLVHSLLVSVPLEPSPSAPASARGAKAQPPAAAGETTAEWSFMVLTLGKFPIGVWPIRTQRVDEEPTVTRPGAGTRTGTTIPFCVGWPRWIPGPSSGHVFTTVANGSASSQRMRLEWKFDLLSTINAYTYVSPGSSVTIRHQGYAIVRRVGIGTACGTYCQ